MPPCQRKKRNKSRIDSLDRGNHSSKPKKGLQQHDSHPPFKRVFGEGLANGNAQPNYPADLTSQSPLHNAKTGPNFSQPIKVNTASDNISYQVNPMIANEDNPMEVNGSESYYLKRESRNRDKNTLVLMEENEPSHQLSPKVTIANTPMLNRVQQWVDGSSSTSVPIVVNGLNPQQAQVKVDNGIEVNHLDHNGVYTPQCTISLSELHTQLTSIACEIKLKTVESLTAASEHVKPQGNEEFFMLYLVILGQFILQGGQAYYVDLPPPASKIPESPQAIKASSSSPVPFELGKINRASQTSDGIDRNKRSPRKLSKIDNTDWNTALLHPDNFELDGLLHSAPLESGGALTESDDLEIDLQYFNGISMNAVHSSSPAGPESSNTSPSMQPSTQFRSLSASAPVFVPGNKGHQIGSGVAGDYVPLESQDLATSPGSHPETAKASNCFSLINSGLFVKEEMPVDPFVTKDSSNTATPFIESLRRTPTNLLTPLTPISPFLPARPSALDSPSPRGRSVAPEPLQIPSDICFIRTNPGSGIRICILTEYMNISETTWIDLPQIGIHLCDESLSERFVQATPITSELATECSCRQYVMGSASWFYGKVWVSILYQEILTYDSLRKFENLERAPTLFAPEPSTIPTGYVDKYGRPIFFRAGSSRPGPKEVSLPSGDDLGVNWNATPVENTMNKLIKLRQMWEEWQEGARDVRWFWYLWKQWGLIKGWTEKPKEHGDNANGKERNMMDHYELKKIAILTSKQESGIKQVDFEDIKNTLNGRTIEQFKRDWEERRRKFGSSNWLA